MPIAVLDLGSNIEREESLAKALEHLAEIVTLRRSSSVYSSSPVGMANQPDYLNLSLEVETDKGVEELRRAARAIEDAMGRNRDVPKYGPRIIDIDVLLYDDVVDEALGLPHPQTETQTFVILPLADLYPESTHPKSGKSWAELRRSLLGGRSPQDAGIRLHGAVDSLPLGPKARQALQVDGSPAVDG